MVEAGSPQLNFGYISACLVPLCRHILNPVAAPSPDQTPSSGRAYRMKRLVVKITILVLLGLTLGCAYDWAVPRIYGLDRVAGFRLGVLHGALMPVALPALLLGKDVPIYAPNNTGRTYKIGYIAGINLCGLLFFGSAFWQPRKTAV